MIFIHILALWPIIAAQDKNWCEIISQLRRRIESRYHLFLRKYPRFSGQTYIIGDVIGGLAAFDYLSSRESDDNDEKSRKASSVSTPAGESPGFTPVVARRSPSLRSHSDASSDSLEFSSLFLFNCPLGYQVSFIY